MIQNIIYMLASYFIVPITHLSMQTSFLQILQFLGNNGYYARTDSERVILQELVIKNLVHIKRGTKSVYQLTIEGKDFLNRELNPNTSIDDEEFLHSLRQAYRDLANPMKPLVRIPDIRKKLAEKMIPDSIFNQKMLELHDQGILTLQTALSKSYAIHGGIESDSGTGVFYYMMFEA